MSIIPFPGRQEILLEIVFGAINCLPETERDCNRDCEFIDAFSNGLNHLLPDNIVERFLSSHNDTIGDRLIDRIIIEIITPETNLKVNDLFNQIIRGLSFVRGSTISARDKLRILALENAAASHQFAAVPEDRSELERHLDMEVRIAPSLAENGHQGSGLLPEVDLEELEVQTSILLSMVVNQDLEPTQETAGKGKNRAANFGPGAGAGYGRAEDE